MASKKREYKAEYITTEQMEDLRRRMRDHTAVNDMAVCVITAKELCQLLDTIEDLRLAIDHQGEP